MKKLLLLSFFCVVSLSLDASLNGDQKQADRNCHVSLGQTAEGLKATFDQRTVAACLVIGGTLAAQACRTISPETAQVIMLPTAVMSAWSLYDYCKTRAALEGEFKTIFLPECQ